ELRRPPWRVDHRGAFPAALRQGHALGAPRHRRRGHGHARQRNQHLLGARLWRRAPRPPRSRQLRGLTLRLVADPSPFWMVALCAAASMLALMCVAPLAFVLAGIFGIIPVDLGILLVAIPTAGIAVPAAAVAMAAWRDLTLPRPVLVIDDAGIFDRRVTDGPVPWGDVKAATSLLPGRGGVVLELDRPVEGRADPFRAGTFLFDRPEPGLLH